MIRPIHHTFAPHVDGRYMLWSLQALLSPQTWRKGKSLGELTETLNRWFEGDTSLFFSGRGALLALLRACDFESGSEIIIQGYTCVALPNAIHAAGYIPVFADIDPQTLNMATDSVRNNITHRTKAIICQHTFGIATDTAALRSIADRHKLLLIEDCAHIIPDVSGPKAIGKNADAIMLSFGRDKAASGITGGAIIVKNPELNAGMAHENKRKKQVPLLTVATLLLYPLLYGIARPLYGIGVGKALLWLAGKCGLLLPVLTRKEKQGFVTPSLKCMPEVSARIVRKQFRNFHSLNNHRRVLTGYYLRVAREKGWTVPQAVTEHLPLQKFPVFTENPDRIRSELKPKNIYLDDGWTGATVCPRTVDQEAAGYVPGTCPHAEQVEQQVLCLPTHPTMTEKQAAKLTEILGTMLT